MKNLKVLSYILLIVGIIIMMLNLLIINMSDFIVRATGIVMIIALFLIVFSSIKINKNR